MDKIGVQHRVRGQRGGGFPGQRGSILRGQPVIDQLCQRLGVAERMVDAGGLKVA